MSEAWEAGRILMARYCEIVMLKEQECVTEKHLSEIREKLANLMDPDDKEVIKALVERHFMPQSKEQDSNAKNNEEYPSIN